MTTKYDETNLTALQGDEETYTFTITLNGVAVDLDGKTIEAHARSNMDSTETLFEIEITDGLNGNDYDAGIVVLVIPAATTAKLPSDCLYSLVNTTDAQTLARGHLYTFRNVYRS